MKILPYERFSIETSLQYEEISKRMDKAISSRLIKGKFKGDCFKIRRVIPGINSFFPVVLGEVFPGIIRITIRMNLYGLIFFVLNLFVLLVVLMISTIVAKSLFAVIIILIFIVALYLIYLMCFQPEVNRIKEILDEIFK